MLIHIKFEIWKFTSEKQTEVHLDADEISRAGASFLTGPSRGVCCGEEGVLAGIAEFASQAPEGVPARSVELNGLRLDEVARSAMRFPKPYFSFLQ